MDQESLETDRSTLAKGNIPVRNHPKIKYICKLRALSRTMSPGSANQKREDEIQHHRLVRLKQLSEVHRLVVVGDQYDFRSNIHGLSLIIELTHQQRKCRTRISKKQAIGHKADQANAGEEIDQKHDRKHRLGLFIQHFPLIFDNSVDLTSHFSAVPCTGHIALTHGLRTPV